MIRGYLFLRQTQVEKYFNRTPWWVSVTGGLRSPLVVSVAPVLPTAGLHARRFLRVHPRPFLPKHSRQTYDAHDNVHRLYGVSIEFDRNASAGLADHGFSGHWPANLQSHRTPQDAGHALVALSLYLRRDDPSAFPCAQLDHFADRLFPGLMRHQLAVVVHPVAESYCGQIAPACLLICIEHEMEVPAPWRDSPKVQT